MSFTKSLFSRKFFLVNLVLIGIMIGFGGAFLALSRGSIAANPGSTTVVKAESPSAIPSAGTALAQAEAIQYAFNAVSEAVLPSVVELDVTSEAAPADRQGQNPFRFFFQNPDQEDAPQAIPQPFNEQGLGSGVIIRKSGKTYYVLTNNHVVGNPKEMTVKLSDEREFKATLVGKDERRDIAVVKFESDDAGIKAASLGDSANVKVGDWAIAIGSPFGLFSSVTVGIVSAIGRNGGPDNNINDFIQTDASINKGNSGGPLVNIRGEVIGINTWIASPSGGSIGLGFSIPINNARKIIDDLISGGTVKYGWLGVSLSEMDKVSRGELKLENRKGAFVAHVFKDGPAKASGIQPGDYVISVDKKAVADVSQLIRIVGDLPAGSKSVFRVIRDGKEMDLKVTIAERKESVASGNENLWPGLSVISLAAEAIDAAQLPKGAKGVLVTNVTAKTPAATMGVKTGDIVTAVNEKDISTVGDFYVAIADPKAKKVQFTVLRDGQTLTTLALVRD